MPRTRSSTRTPRRPGVPGPGDSHLCLPLKTVTPVFGGGYRPAELDDLDPVRVPGIRGQLRFFWRALYGHEFPDPAALAKREAELWGGASSQRTTRSKVDLWVTDVLGAGYGRADPSSLQNTPAGYVLWPAGLGRGKNEKWAPRRRPGMRFRLHVRVDANAAEREAEVLASLKAWLLFGGLGSRVRRGCGSLALDLDAIKADRSLTMERRDWLPARADGRSVDQVLGAPFLTDKPAMARDTPSLRGARLFAVAPMPDAGKAWEHAVGWLKEFRADRRRGESSGKVKIEGNPSVHARLLAPAANLGLPVVNLGGDAGVRLAWRERGSVGRERLASPLIVKALPLLGGTFAPVALWLHRADLDGDVVWTAGDVDAGQSTGVAARPIEELRDAFGRTFTKLDAAVRNPRKHGRGGRGGGQPRRGKPPGRPPRNTNKGRKSR